MPKGGEICEGSDELKMEYEEGNLLRNRIWEIVAGEDTKGSDEGAEEDKYTISIHERIRNNEATQVAGPLEAPVRGTIRAPAEGTDDAPAEGSDNRPVGFFIECSRRCGAPADGPGGELANAPVDRTMEAHADGAPVNG
jgi:hypothetical protein